MVPPAQARQLLEASKTWLDQQKKAGTLLEDYAIPGGKTAVICEHSSFEDFNRVVMTLPTYGFMHFEVFPLADMGEYMKTSIEAYKAAEKMFPSRELAGVH
jgi:hypothetical protein